jgi:nitrate reductase delta subunit
MANAELCQLLSDLLTYPDAAVPAKAERCQSLLATVEPGVVAAMGKFAAATSAITPGRLEELYSACFDLAPACCPYAAYHLFGEGPKRSALMVRLQAAQQEMGLSRGGELPDHVAVLFAFLGRLGDTSEGIDLQSEVLGPALGKMAHALAGSDNPYRHLVDAAWALVGRVEAPAGHAGAAAGEPADSFFAVSPPCAARGAQGLDLACGGAGDV